MITTETIEEFYRSRPYANASGLSLYNAGVGHINVFSRSAWNKRGESPYARRDFYKISLVIGTGTVNYAEKWIAIDRPALIFSNPLVPYSWEALSSEQEGWFCLFTEAFIQSRENKETLNDSPLFRAGGDHIFFLSPAQVEEISSIFRKMIVELHSDYAHKYDLLRNYLHLLIHAGIKMQPAEGYSRHANAASRTTAMFLELLERQFPIDSPDKALRLRSANDYAHYLSVHTNHLNRSVKQVTGKTTTHHIAARIVREAEALLLHTDWDIAQIGYGLGFEEPASFTNFFKKHTRQSPGTFRQRGVSQQRVV
jgi:AraC-like DNA-binding protein